MGYIFFLNGRFVPEEQAKVSVLERGFLYGDGVFETMRSYQGKIFRIDEHLSRLKDALDKLMITPSDDISQLKKNTFEVLHRNKLSEAYMRINITRGLFMQPQEKTSKHIATMLILIRKFIPYPDKCYRQGIRAIIATTRQNENSPLANIKSLNYLNNLMAKTEALRRGAQEAIMLNSKGLVCEGAISNIFIVKGKDLYTPAITTGCLNGITRNTVIEIARRKQILVKETDISIEQLSGADEIFITNSLMEVMPVVEINNRRINRARIGRLTQFLMKEYRKVVEHETRHSK
ncbi:MAG: aminodeoxychorismate lyase [Candidatus Omnitrophota bacterium]